MRRFIENSQGLLIDMDRIDCVVRTKNRTGWVISVSGMAVPVSESVAKWIKDQISQGAEIVQTPPALVDESEIEPPQPDEESSE